MWFSAGYWSGGPFVYWAQIYHAVSMDGFYWNVTGVVLPPNQFWDRGMTNSPWVVRDSAGLFWLFHSGWDGSNTRIGVATSGDGSHLHMVLIKNTTVKDEVPVPLTLDATPRIAALGTVAAIDAAVVGLALVVGRRPPRRPSAPPPQEWPRIQPPGPS